METDPDKLRMRSDLVHFVVNGINGLYVPMAPFVRLIAPEDLPQAQDALNRGRKAWLN